jgi:hypothetical protein
VLATIGLLDYRARIALLQTNRYFRASVSPQACSAEDKRAFVHAAESFRQNADGFGCYRCFRVLPRSDFAEKQIRGHRGRGNSKGYQRFCFPCAEKYSIYTPGSQLIKSGVRLWVCYQCRKPKEGRLCIRCGKFEECVALNQNDIHGIALKCDHDMAGASPEKARPNRQCPITSLAVAWRIAEFQQNFREMASPEWFDGDDFP